MTFTHCTCLYMMAIVAFTYLFYAFVFICYTDGLNRNMSEKNTHIYKCTFTSTFSHLADTFVQSDVQGREQSSYEQYRPSVTINTILHKKKKIKCRNVTAVRASFLQ